MGAVAARIAAAAARSPMYGLLSVDDDESCSEHDMEAYGINRITTKAPKMSLATLPLVRWCIEKRKQREEEKLVDIEERSGRRRPKHVVVLTQGVSIRLPNEGCAPPDHALSDRTRTGRVFASEDTIFP